MGHNLPYIDLGQGVVSVALDENPATSCAVLVDNSVKCWGVSATYGYGYGDTLPRGTSPGTMGNMGNGMPNVTTTANFVRRSAAVVVVDVDDEVVVIARAVWVVRIACQAISIGSRNSKYVLVTNNGQTHLHVHTSSPTLLM
eukprot:3355998-Amphidinium_carterae.1